MDISTSLRGPVESMARHTGWGMALRGILAVAFGVIVLARPMAGLAMLVVLFAVWAFADAVLSFINAARLGRAGERWGWYVFEGLVSTALGVLAIALPGVTLLMLVLLVALRALVLGITELIFAFSWKTHESRWMLGLAGVLSIVLAVLLFDSPGIGALVLVWTIGLYGIIFGVALFAFGLRLMGLARQEREAAPREHRAPPVAPTPA